MNCWDYWPWGVAFGLLYAIDWIILTEILDVLAKRRLERLRERRKLK